MHSLTIQNLSIRFNRYAARMGTYQTQQLVPVRDLTLTARENDLTVILGASGSGKTLLAHTLVGILPRNAQVSGHLVWDGCALPFDTFFRLHKISFIPQSLSYLDPLITIRQQAMDIARLNGLNGEQAAQIIQEYLRECRLDERVLSLYPHQLSGGMARRILILLSRLNPAQILVADEPTPGLDEVLLDDVWNYLAGNKAGRVNLVITHDLRNAMCFADLVYVFDDGAIVDSFEPARQNYGDFTRRLIACLPENQFTDYFKGARHDRSI